MGTSFFSYFFPVFFFFFFLRFVFVVFFELFLFFVFFLVFLSLKRKNNFFSDVFWKCFPGCFVSLFFSFRLF